MSQAEASPMWSQAHLQWASAIKRDHGVQLLERARQTSPSEAEALRPELQHAQRQIQAPHDATENMAIANILMNRMNTHANITARSGRQKP